MSDYDKPDVLPAWAEGGDTNDVPTGAEIQEGWPQVNTPPTRQRFNWLLHWLANAIRYFMQMGIPEWDAEEDYRSGSRVQKADRTTWVALRANTNVVPGTSPADWQAWGAIDQDADLNLYENGGNERNLGFNNGVSTSPGTALRQWLLGTDATGKFNIRRFNGAGVEQPIPLDIDKDTGKTRVRLLDAWGSPITGVADGVANTDAANVGQLILYGNNYASDDSELFINPHGGIQQESTTPRTTSGYFADQWFMTAGGSGFTAETGVEATGLSNYDPKNIYCKTTAAKPAITGADYVLWGQIFEGQRFARLLYGTAKARGSWIRFRAVADAAGTASFSISNYAGTRSYVRTFNVTAGEQDYTFFIPGDVTGSWGTNTNGAAFFYICYAATGAGMLTSTLDAWQGALYFGGTAQTNFLDGTARKLRVTDFSWKPSNVLLPFRAIEPQLELEKCRRYWQYMNFTSGRANTANNIDWAAMQCTPMRAAPSPSITKAAHFIVVSGVGGQTSAGSTIVGSFGGHQNQTLTVNGYTGLTAGNHCLMADAAVVAANARM